MSSRLPDEEVGVVPASSEQDTGPSSRPSTRTGRSSPPPPHDNNNLPHPYSVEADETARSFTGRVWDHNNSELDIESPENWIWKNYGQYLVTKVKPWPFKSSNQGEESFEVNLAEIQRMYLVQLRIRMARHIARWELSAGKELRTSWKRQRKKMGNDNDDDDGMEPDDCWRLICADTSRACKTTTTWISAARRRAVTHSA